MYNTTFINSSNSFVDLTTGINTESGSLFAIILLIVVFFITFISVKHFSTKTAGVTASFTTSLICILMVSINWISFEIMIIPLVLLMFSVLYLKFSE